MPFACLWRMRVGLGHVYMHVRTYRLCTRASAAREEVIRFVTSVVICVHVGVIIMING